VAKCILLFISGTKLHVCPRKSKLVDVTSVIKKEKLFVYQVGQMKRKRVQNRLVTLMEKHVFMGIALNLINAPVKLDGKE